MSTDNKTRQSSLTCNRTNGLPVTLQKLAASIGLLLLAPVFLLVAIAIKLESPGPVIFTQIRVGHCARRFRFFKFRSMYLPSDHRYVEPDQIVSTREGICSKYFDDPRITKVGKFIRKYSIDELPQLINVLTGDMSLVGPRPALVKEVDQYALTMFCRFRSLPGLTGLWQVSGRADTSFDEQIQLDLEYVKQQSIWMDIKILLSTVPAVLAARGAY